MFPAEMNDLVGLPRTDGYVEVISPDGYGILVVNSDTAAQYVALGWVAFDEYQEI